MADPVLPAPFTWRGAHVHAHLPGGEVLFTTRRGGVSQGPYASLNLGPWTEDDATAVDANRRRVAVAVGRPVVGVRQVHGTDVREVGAKDADRDPREAPVEADALLTVEPELAIGVVVADCLPVAFVGQDVVGMAHAGWRGLAGGVLERTVQRLRARPGGQTLVAAIGPAARGCCYEVGDEVRSAFAEHGAAVRAGRRIDLPAIATRLLRGLGISEVHDTGLCTLCAPADLLFSHRRDGGLTGRQMGLAWRS
ncbi:peptidoglycan editing factor PgeF [Paraconexibacter sp.]|uniref:peptidoglycan editing factor PgeF n=1 Tax=Paraconexibacter sp. TaxID=2949640 RepID=UPI00356749F9